MKGRLLTVSFTKWKHNRLWNASAAPDGNSLPGPTEPHDVRAQACQPPGLQKEPQAALYFVLLVTLARAPLGTLK